MEAKEFNKLLKQIKYDRNAFNEIYAYYFIKIKRYVEVNYRDLNSAEDIAQQTFLSLYVNPPAEYIGAPATWLYTIAANRAKTILKRENRVVLVDDEVLNCVEYVMNESKMEVRRLLDMLDDLSRKIVALNIWFGFTFEEIAVKLKINPATARQRASRAYKKLKKYVTINALN